MSETGPSAITVHSPRSSHPSLAQESFDRSWLMVISKLKFPTLQDKKDVTITYSPVAAGSKITTTFDDLVEYRKRSADAGSTPSRVKGVDTLSTGANGATFDWRGSGMLFFVSSHWEVLGYGTDRASDLEWAVTFFSKTLFTPAGADVYIRRSPNASPPPSGDENDHNARRNLLASIVLAVQANEDEGVRKLTEKGFEVPSIV